MIKIACAGRFLTSLILFAPRYCEIIDEIALRVCPKIQISIDKNVPTIPTAAIDSAVFIGILPIIAASVSDNIGSEIPEINAGIANLLICFELMSIFKILIRNSKKDIHFV